MSKIIAVANQKCGVGKTNTSVNLSACLAEKRKRVLLLDCDPQGNATSGVGVDKRGEGASIYEVLINDVPLRDAVIHTKWNNLDVCKSGIQLAGADIELIGRENREFCLKNALNDIKAQYDFIIIDCPPSLSILTLNAFAAADTVLIPIQCEYYALEGLAQLTNTIRQVRKAINPDLDIEGALMTMYDSRTNLSIEVVQEVKRALPKKVFKTLIPRNVRLSEAPSFGEPVINYDGTSRGADAYRALAQEIISNNR